MGATREKIPYIYGSLKGGGFTVYGFIGNVGPWELILILAIALIIFGPGKLPEAGKAIGRAMREFRNASSGLKNEIQEAVSLDEKDQKANTNSSST